MTTETIDMTENIEAEPTAPTESAVPAEPTLAPEADVLLMGNRGLTSAEVAERVAAGKVNGTTEVRTKSYWNIFRSNTFTLFNALNVNQRACNYRTDAIFSNWRRSRTHMQ